MREEVGSLGLAMPEAERKKSAIKMAARKHYSLPALGRLKGGGSLAAVQGKSEKAFVSKEETKGEEEEKKEDDEQGGAAEVGFKESSVVLQLHWGHMKRPRCTRSTDHHHHHHHNYHHPSPPNKEEQVVAVAVVEEEEEEEEGLILCRASKIRLAKKAEKIRGRGRSSKACTPDHQSNNGEATLAGFRRNEANPPLPESRSSLCSEPAMSDAAAMDTNRDGTVKASEKLDLDFFEWPRILISLSHKEKEEDFLVMKGTKLPQRPKKRPKLVDKALHYCCPGYWLSDLTRGRYDVKEKKCLKKRPRGLKAMANADTDSD